MRKRRRIDNDWTEKRGGSYLKGSLLDTFRVLSTGHL